MTAGPQQQAQPNDAVQNNHHCCKNRITRQRGSRGTTLQHQHHDQRYLDDGDGQRQQQGAIGFAHTVRNDFGVVYGSQHADHQGGSDH